MLYILITLPEAKAERKKNLVKMMQALQLSAHSYVLTLKVCSTIADLSTRKIIEFNHIAEACYFRSLDKPLAFPGNNRKN